MGNRKRSEVRGSHLSGFQNPITTVVDSGTFVDFELPCDIKAHQQMHVKVGVIEEVVSDQSDAPKQLQLQLLDKKPVSGNKILVLRQPRLRTTSQFLPIPWPSKDETIRNATC